MGAFFNILDLEPTKHYATVENAQKAVQAYADRLVRFEGERIFNVLMLPVVVKGKNRICPVLVNFREEHITMLVQSGFNLIH